MITSIHHIALATGEDPRQQLRQIGLVVVLPILTFAAFLGLWSAIASNVETKFGTVPATVTPTGVSA